MPRWTGRVVVRGGAVIDGTGAEPFHADVAIQGETIAEIGNALEGDHVFDASNAKKDFAIAF